MYPASGTCVLAFGNFFNVQNCSAKPLYKEDLYVSNHSTSNFKRPNHSMAPQLNINGFVYYNGEVKQNESGIFLKVSIPKVLR